MKLYEWQEKALKLSETEQNMALFAVMGTGKTFCAITIARSKYAANGRMLRTLVLGPVSVVYNWKREFLAATKVEDDRIFVSTGNSNKRAEKLGKHVNKYNQSVIITNYESLRNKALFEHLMEWKPEIVICDESHSVKSIKALQAKQTFKLSQHAMHTYLLSGTPITNDMADIFMQYKIMDKGDTFGNNFFSFRNTYFFDCNAGWAGKHGYFPKWEPIKELYPMFSEKILKKAVRVLKEECLDLPERIEKTYEVELSKVQEKAYKEMKRDLVTFILDRKDEPQAVVAQLALTKALRLQQITTGFVQTEKKEIIDLGDNPRLRSTREILVQVSHYHKTILWCSFVHNYRQLEKMCQELNLPYVLITGEQNAEQKQESVDSFNNDEKIRVVIANRRAGGVGLSLVAASYSIIYSRNFSLTEEEQSQARNYRAGSEIHKRIVKIDLCARGTIDELCMKALQGKKKMASILLDEIENI